MTFKLPKEKTETLYVAYNFAYHPDGSLAVFSFDPEVGSSDDWIVVAEKEVTIKIPPVDLIPVMVSRLEEIKKKAQADHEVAMTDIKTKIDNLLAIEYHGELEPIEKD